MTTSDPLDSTSFRDRPHSNGDNPSRDGTSGARALSEQIIHEFGDVVGQQGGAEALVVLALCKNGQILGRQNAPGGLIQLLGLLEAGKAMFRERQFGAK